MATSTSRITDRMFGALRLDGSIYEEIEADPKATGEAAFVVVASSLVAAAGYALRVGGAVNEGLLGAIAELVGWALYAWFAWLVGTRLIPGANTKADWGQVARTLGYATTPRFFLILLFVPFLAGVVRVVVSLWILVATIVALRSALDCGTGRAIIVAVIASIVQTSSSRSSSARSSRGHGTQDKRATLSEAVATFVRDGMSIAIGCALEPAIPFAFAHELIRQRKRDLTLIGPISDILFDQLIGAGCVARVEAAWVGNVSAGLAHCYRRALEQGIPRPIEVRDHSNFSIAQALLAGALGAPYIPTRTLLGSDIPRANGTFREATSPFDGSKVLLIPAIVPDLTVIACQVATAQGEAGLTGPWGVSREAALAARQVIVICERIGADELPRQIPNVALVPATKVGAVVVEPGACHPSPLENEYDRDHEFFHEYHRATRTQAGFDAWCAEWITALPDRAAYLRKLGARWRALRPAHVRQFFEPV